jgi:hypothetical protein
LPVSKRRYCEKSENSGNELQFHEWLSNSSTDQGSAKLA